MVKERLRQNVEFAVSKLKKKLGESYEPTSLTDKLESLDECDEMIKIWSELSQLRNDLAHCGILKE